MKIELLPDFAKPFKKPGYDVRFVNNQYQLFKISSKRVKGCSYPKLSQEYVGTITEKDGLIISRVIPSNKLVEFGLSSFILTYFKRQLLRSLFNTSNDDIGLVYLAIIQFIYHHYEERFIKLSYISKYENKYSIFLKLNPEKKILNLSNRIQTLFKELIHDDLDRDYLIEELRNIKVSLDDDNPSYKYNDEIKTILNKYGVKYYE